jgi:hypothetical protein
MNCYLKIFFMCFSIVHLIVDCGKQEEPPIIPRAKAELSSGTVMVDDFNLKYIVAGVGIPCMVVGSHIFWPRTFSEDLRNHLRFIFADCRLF